MRPRLAQWLATSFDEDEPQPPKDPDSCPPTRPAMKSRVRCPGVGPEIQTTLRESSDVCPPQPPPCCESAKRAEHAVKLMDKIINGNHLLKLFSMSSSPWWLAALPGPPRIVGQCRLVDSRKRQDLAEFL
mmetsp:Transcript_40095/g.63643  ORF Transcript_40095/g.63643 Transcript_40095/m.63643 type:complete len:130 (+) Transcript_40095:99-488(+)|eukprot:CAMPEP_0169061600 /NCGR_PEP_ID=MMETSP1015-20121227/209_1 /TAXON_ID=342587 /ORGANISM="Karlodinium micrum, Strain CCMP2283" /LENGTH=129 /DNA_ID=CAMNT_0009119623 /DNA_START=96 /DNA_END=485 /DNA_ORIENTATION=+